MYYFLFNKTLSGQGGMPKSRKKTTTNLSIEEPL